MQQLHYTHHYANLMVSRYTTLVPSLGLCTGPACEAGLSNGMRKECAPLHRKKKEKDKEVAIMLAVLKLRYKWI